VIQKMCAAQAKQLGLWRQSCCCNWRLPMNSCQ
jgi:hypothetical protein